MALRRPLVLIPPSEWPDGMYLDEDGSPLTSFFQVVISFALVLFATGWAQVLGAFALFLSVALLLAQPKIMDAIVRRYTDQP